jgi:hypothetical protein
MKAPRRIKYRVMQRDEGGGSARAIGILALAPDCALSIVSAEPDGAAFLQDIVDRSNALAVLHVAAAPPEDAPEGAVYTRPVRRTDGEFRQALLDRLRRYYAIDIEPA